MQIWAMSPEHRIPVVHSRVEGLVGGGGGGDVGCLLHVEGGGVGRPGVGGQGPARHVGRRGGAGIPGETARVAVNIICGFCSFSSAR